MNALQATLSKNHYLSNDSIELISTTWNTSKQLKAKESLLALNQINTNIYFVLNGCVRLYVTNENGEENNLGFGYENTIITCFQSFINETPSLLNIEAILDTNLISISKEDLMKLINEHQDIAQWYQNMLEKTISGHIQRQVELLTLTPQKRYEIFIKRSGHLVNLIPLKHIASYLMMTPETLSRIRAKIS